MITAVNDIETPYDRMVRVTREDKLPAENFSAGNIAMPIDGALRNVVGNEDVFVGSGILNRPTLARSGHCQSDKVF